MAARKSAHASSRMRVRRRKSRRRRRSERGPPPDREAGWCDAEEIWQSPDLPLGEAPLHDPPRARGEDAAELAGETRARVVGRGRHHPAVVMHHVEPELVEGLLDEPGDERDRGVGRDQPTGRRRVTVVDPLRERGRVVEHAPVVDDQEGHERVLVEGVDVRMALDRASSLRPLHPPVGAEVSEPPALGREPLVRQLGPFETGAELQGERG